MISLTTQSNHQSIRYISILSLHHGINEHVSILILYPPSSRGVIRFLRSILEDDLDCSVGIRSAFPVLFVDFLLPIREIDDFPASSSSSSRLHVNDCSIRKDRVLVSGSVDSLDGSVRKPDFLGAIRIRNLRLSVVELQGLGAVGGRRVTGFRQGVKINLGNVTGNLSSEFGYVVRLFDFECEGN